MTTAGDRVAGVAGATAGGMLWCVFESFPAGDDGWANGVAASSGTVALSWVLVLSWVLALLGYMGFGFFTLVLAGLDVRTLTLPNRLIAWASLWTMGLLSAASLVRGDGPIALMSLAIAVLLTAPVFALWWWARGGLGGGDLKLFPLAAFAGVWGQPGGAWLSAVLVFLGLLAAGLVVVGTAALMLGKRHIPAAPILVVASWGAFVLTRMPEV